MCPCVSVRVWQRNDLGWIRPRDPDQSQRPGAGFDVFSDVVVIGDDVPQSTVTALPSVLNHASARQVLLWLQAFRQETFLRRQTPQPP